MEVYETRHPLLKKFIVNIYFWDKSDKQTSYTVFPATVTPISITRNVEIDITPDEISINSSDIKKNMVVVYSLLMHRFRININIPRDCIAINFQPGCIPAFIPDAYAHNKSTHLSSDWDEQIEPLLCNVFSADSNDKLKLVEDFLLANYLGTAHYQAVYEAALILSDFQHEYTIEEIAAMTGMSYKHLYRDFVKYLGCSPAHFRRVARFRTSVYDKIINGGSMSLTEISYGNNYTDQSYFIKEFRKHTGDNPRDFFKNVTVLGNNKMVWKFM